MALTMSSPLTFHVTLGLSFSTSGPGEMKPTDKWVPNEGTDTGI